MSSWRFLSMYHKISFHTPFNRREKWNENPQMVEHAYLKAIFLTQEGDSLSTQLSVRMHPKRRHSLTQVRARIAYSAYKERFEVQIWWVTTIFLHRRKLTNLFLRFFRQRWWAIITSARPMQGWDSRRTHNNRGLGAGRLCLIWMKFFAPLLKDYNGCHTLGYRSIVTKTNHTYEKQD